MALEQIDKETLVLASKKVMENSYAPYSNFKVGAAVLCTDGRIYCGCNVENASYGLTVCAERTATFAMACEGGRKIRAIAISSSTGKPVFPCGACRQVLAEFAPAEDDLYVYLASDQGVLTYTLAELLPHAFTLIKT